MSLKLQTIADVVASSKPSFLVYGHPGTGKTTFTGTFPGKTLVVELNETGVKSIADNKQVTVARIEKFEDFQELMDKLPALQEKMKFDNISIDTINGLQTLYFRDIIKKERPVWDDWGKWGNKLTSVLVFLKQFTKEAGISLVYIAHAKNFASANDKGDQVGNDWGPLLNPAAATKLEAMTDINMKMETRKVQVLDANKRKVIDKTTGKVKTVEQFVGVLAKSTGNRTKFRTTLKALKDKDGEIFFKNPSYKTFAALFAAEKKQNK